MLTVLRILGEDVVVGGGGGEPGGWDAPACFQDSIEWIDSLGRSWHWPYQPQGIEGRGAPPPVVDEEEWSGDGSIFRSLRYGPREIIVPLTLGISDCLPNINTPVQVRNAMRDWVRAVAGARHGGTLRFSTLTGDDREIYCVYAGGMDWIETSTRRLMQAVVLRAHDPFFYDTTDTVITWLTTTVASFFPIPNPSTGSFITLSAGAVIADEIVNNTGDDETWPVWTLTGPTFGEIQILNQDTGERIYLDVPLLADQSITIDTRIGKKSVFDSDGNNRFAELSADSVLFPLPVGPTSLRITMENAEAGTSARLSFRRRWLTA